MSIVVRPYRATDKPAIQAMHKEMGFDYEQPDWDKWSPLPIWRNEGRGLFIGRQCVGLADTPEIALLIVNSVNSCSPVSAVITVDEQPQMAAFLRKTAETFMLCNPEASRKAKVQELLIMHRELLIPAKRAGYEDVHAWPPPQIEPKFGKLMMHMGWQKQLWPSYCFEVK